MVRFLTPPKVMLLVLAHLYTEGAIPISSSTHILSFILKNIILDADDDHNRTGNLTLHQFENALAKHASSIPGRTVWDLLVKGIWSIDCSDALDTFITTLPSLLSKSRDQLLRERDTGEVSEQPAGKIVRTSPLGVFIRRCHLEYDRLHFQDSLVIWEDLIAFRLPTRTAYEKKNGRDAADALDVNLSDLNIDPSHPMVHIMFGHLIAQQEQGDPSPVWSSHDVEKLLEFQVSEMQRMGGRLPEDMKTKLHQMSRAGATLPKLSHYLKYLDSWRAGDFASAFDNLHRYFDYTMQSRDRTFYQYALLNLAILQADFGCYGEAIPAIQEAIATARENKDTTCLNFCMSWLYHFGRSFPAQMKEIRDKGMLGGEYEGLQFLKSRAKDAEMWSLLSSTLLSEARLGLQQGESIAVVFENIVKASHINIVKSVPNATGPALLMKSSVFARIGQSHMASLCGETFLACHGDKAPLEDILRCSCRLANLLAQQGRYVEADALMDEVPAEVLQVLKYQIYWNFFANTLKLRRLLHRNDLDTAWTVLRRLQGQDAPDVEFKSTVAIFEIEYLIRRNELSQALLKVEALADLSQKENNDVMIQAKVLTLKARLLATAGKPLLGFSLTMRAANMAYNARILPALWDAIIGLATILITLQEFTATKDLLEAILPQVLECRDGDLAARSHSLLADVFMGLAQTEVDDINQKEHVNVAMHHLNRAVEQWKHMEDLHGQLECLHKIATIQSWRGDVVVANDTASLFLKVWDGRNVY